MKKSKATSKPSLNKKATLGDPGVFSLPDAANEALLSEDEVLEDDVPKSYIHYEDRYVAFIDILGFKEIVRSSRNQINPNSTSSLNSIFNALNLNFGGFAKDYESKCPNTPVDLRVNTFSDFVVISSNVSEAGLDVLIFVVWSIVRDWLSKGYLSRGGIVKGQVIHVEGGANSPGMVFGPAFIEAYTLEHEVADYPRVVFSKAVRTDLNNFQTNGQNTISAIKKLVIKCEDGPLCIDLFGHLRKSGFDFLGCDNETEVNQFQRTLHNQLDHGADTPRWYRKIAWLVGQFNEAVADTAYVKYRIQG